MEDENKRHNRNIETLKDGKKVLQNQLNSEKEKNYNLRNQIRQQGRDLTNENTKLQKSISTRTRERDQKMTCKGQIVENNGLTLFKEQSEIKFCQDNGIYNEPENSLLIFDWRAKNGDNERAVITRGLSSRLDKTGNYTRIGNEDKIITSFNTKGSERKYSFDGACGVMYKGIMHFFGGYSLDYPNQHFGLSEKRNFVKYKYLGIGFHLPQCSTFKISKPNSQSADKEVVLLCFDAIHKKNCYQYDDGELTHFVDANKGHYLARLGKYKNQLITVGDALGKRLKFSMDLTMENTNGLLGQIIIFPQVDFLH